jgi:hypothetical protein
VPDEHGAAVGLVRRAFEEAGGFDGLHQLAHRLARGAHPPGDGHDPGPFGVDVGQEPDVTGLHVAVTAGVEPVRQLVGLDLGGADQQPQQNRLPVPAELRRGDALKCRHSAPDLDWKAT